MNSKCHKKKNTVRPQVSPQGAYLFQVHLGGGEGGLFKLEKNDGINSP